MSQNDLQQTRLATASPASPSASKSTGATTSIEKNVQKMIRKKRPTGKMIAFGAMSLGAYFLVFSNEHLITQTFTLGGWHAAFPVLTAFAFSFIHGAFASNLLSVLGLEAKK